MEAFLLHRGEALNTPRYLRRSCILSLRRSVDPRSKAAGTCTTIHATCFIVRKWCCGLFVSSLSVQPPVHYTLFVSCRANYVHLATMGEIRKALKSTTPGRVAVAMGPQHQKQQRADWAREYASLRKLAVRLDSEVHHGFLSTCSDLQQVGPCTSSTLDRVVPTKYSKKVDDTSHTSPSFLVCRGSAGRCIAILR